MKAMILFWASVAIVCFMVWMMYKAAKDGLLYAIARRSY